MTKAIDCVECGAMLRAWKRLRTNARDLHSRRIGRRQIRNAKRLHGINHYHEYTQDYSLNNWVMGTNNRQLINKGGKP